MMFWILWNVLIIFFAATWIGSSVWAAVLIGPEAPWQLTLAAWTGGIACGYAAVAAAIAIRGALEDL